MTVTKTLFDGPSSPVESTQGDSAFRWYLRGTAAGMLVMAAVNAISYFIRSDQWSSLLGRQQSYGESVGFPFKVWEGGNTYGGLFVDYPMLAVNAVVAFAVGSLLGLLVARRTDALNQMMRDFESETHDRQPHPIQFSLKGLLIVTTMAAVVATVAQNFAARKETLIAIYLLGPSLLVMIAMIPRRISWHKRVAIIIPATFIMIASAIAVGTAMNMEFDRVLMGIFLCWTPQSALAAAAITTPIVISQTRGAPEMVKSSPASQ